MYFECHYLNNVGGAFNSSSYSTFLAMPRGS